MLSGRGRKLLPSTSPNYKITKRMFIVRNAVGGSVVEDVIGVLTTVASTDNMDALFPLRGVLLLEYSSLNSRFRFAPGVVAHLDHVSHKSSSFLHSDDFGFARCSGPLAFDNPLLQRALFSQLLSLLQTGCSQNNPYQFVSFKRQI
jgi:hypothetical protein